MCSVIADFDFTRSQLNASSEHNLWPSYKPDVEEFLPATLFTSVYSMLPMFDYHPWFFSLIGSTVIGLSGVFPLLVIPLEEEEGNFDLNGAGKRTLKVLLSFAVGCLLGDVFLHLLPEVWIEEIPLDGSSHPSMNKGLWILAGLLIFTVLEKIFACLQENEDENETSSPPPKVEMTKTNSGVNNGFVMQHNIINNNNNYPDKNEIKNDFQQTEELPKKSNRQRTTSIHVSGYLNLMANSFDNFTHGLAVGGSFIVSLPHGLLTTFAILLHEIPHEVGDFAILLRSGFTRWDAAKAQVLTAFAGIIGALTSVAVSGSTGAIEARTSWMLPFTAGGFLHIALVTVLPDLLKEENPRESFTQLASLLLGIGVIAGLNTFVPE